MKSKPNTPVALRTRWRYRPEWLAALSRRGVCLQRYLSHAAFVDAGASMRPSRRALSHRWGDRNFA